VCACVRGALCSRAQMLEMLGKHGKKGSATRKPIPGEPPPYSAKSKKGLTPLMLASQEGHTEVRGGGGAVVGLGPWRGWGRGGHEGGGVMKPLLCRSWGEGCPTPRLVPGRAALPTSKALVGSYLGL
jgi:hypothetical protein